MKDDIRLTAELKKKKRGSLERVIGLYTPYVSTVAYNIIGSSMTKEDVEEVVSDAFFALWRHASELEAEKGGIRAYLGAAARNIAKNKLRKAGVCEELTELSAVCDGDIGADVERRESRSELIDLITALGEPDSEIFMRYYFYEERTAHIAEALGMSVSAVKSRLMRGRGKLKEKLSDKEVRQ